MSDLPSSSNPNPPWKQLKLSLERPYKDDQSNPIPVLLDLTPEGERIYEPKETAASRLSSNLLRIFQERGVDFFDRSDTLRSLDEESKDKPTSAEEEDESSDSPRQNKPMTPEELFQMRSAILPQLYVALGEMTQAQALLASLLSNTETGGSLSIMPTLQEGVSKALATTTVTKPAPITSVEAFNAQLVLGNKDESLRKASDLFKVAAESMERSHSKSEKYWVNALRIRQSNWGLIPAPLPPGSATGKGADKTSKDFVIAYGLEGSPPSFRRRAIARLTDESLTKEDIDFLMHQNTRLQIGIVSRTPSGTQSFTYTSPLRAEGHNLDRVLQSAQTETVDQEVFSVLVREAADLPTAPARVSERLIAIDAAQGVELTFALVDTAPSAPNLPKGADRHEDDICELIYHALRVLLIRRRSNPSGAKDKARQPPQSILQFIVDMLQYRVFYRRIYALLDEATKAVNKLGIPTILRFTGVGGTGEEAVALLCNYEGKSIGGEAVIRIHDWHTIRLTFTSPSSLTAHVSQSRLTISSLPQLSQLLTDELEKCLLQRICKLGADLCQDGSGSSWFIDLNRCVARWEGCVLNIRITFTDGFAMGCTVFRLDESTGRQGVRESYPGGPLPLLTWIANIIKAARSRST